MISYKDASIDPISDPKLKTDLWRNVGRAEQALVGVQFLTYNDFTMDGSNNTDHTITYNTHWAYQEPVLIAVIKFRV